MSIYEYDFDEHMDVIREESCEDGFAEGEAKGLVVGEAKGRAEDETIGAAKEKAKTQAETSRDPAGRGFKAAGIAEIINAGIDEAEQWLPE